jgi:hypothetical protein
VIAIQIGKGDKEFLGEHLRQFETSRHVAPHFQILKSSNSQITTSSNHQILKFP